MNDTLTTIPGARTEAGTDAFAAGAPPAGKNADKRGTAVLRMEWTLVVLRYAVYVLLGILSVAIKDSSLRRAFLVIGTLALAHNIFAHWVFHTRRYERFVSLGNFLLYLLWTCLLVGITDGAASPLAPLFFLLIIGYHIYSPRASNTLYITLAVCASYSFTVLVDWVIGGLQWTYLPMYLNLILIGFCGWVMDVLARMIRALEHNARLKETALESSEATLRAILNHTAHPIIVYDENELITDVNESACNFLGLSRQAVIGLRFRSLVFDDGAVSESLDNLKRTGSLHQEMLVLPVGGLERNVYMHIHSFLGEGRRFFVALFHDITNQKELQEANRLAKMNLEKANQELQRVVDLRAAFYINVANRLRSPLAAILGFTDMLLEEQLGELNEEQRKAIHSNKRNLMRIFEQLDEAFALEKGLAKEAADAGSITVDSPGAGL